ncbi:endospore germination permease [Paenibacillus sp. GCM10027628]|uniref:GerAB/ArcD/ProY family transporter n=1 Tax=Paenibacillus sp. GCM10027628 TaxID=3273413 RepID=UPI00363FE335
MMKYQRITHLQFFFIQAMASIGMVTLRFPAHVIQAMDRHAWMIVVFAFIIAMINLFIAMSLTKRHPNENLIEISRRYLGKWVGAVYALFVIGESFLLSILMFWENWAYVSYTQLKNTPVGLIAVLFLLVILYLLLTGLEAWSRLVQILGFFLLISIPLLNLPQLSNANFGRLLPLTNVDWGQLHNNLSLHGLLMFKGILVIFFLKPHVQDNGKLFPLSIFALLLAFFQVLPSFLLPVAVFGAKTAAKFSFPYSESMETAPLYLLPIEKISFIAPFFYLMLLTVMMLVSLYCCEASIRTLLKTKKERPIFIIITILAMSILIWPVSLPFTMKIYPYWSYMYLFVFILVPIYMWVAGLLRKKAGAAH